MPENLHLWTIEFAMSTSKRAGDAYKVEAQRGMIDLFVKSDRRTGIIDFYFGREGSYGFSPSHPLPNNKGVIYIFTQLEPKDAPAKLFRKPVLNVKKELQILK